MCADRLLLPSSAAKASHSPLVSKIDNRLEQYTSAAQVGFYSTVHDDDDEASRQYDTSLIKLSSLCPAKYLSYGLQGTAL